LSDGSRYEGEFHDNKFHGRGVVTVANGNRYEGEFRDGKLDGQGTLTMSNGAHRYEGEFRDGKPNGFGTFSQLGGKLTGTWTNGCGRDGRRTARVLTT